MAENPGLDAFLEANAETAPAPGAEAEKPAAQPAPEPKADTGGAGAKAPPKHAEADDDDGEPPEALDGEPIVPKRAFEKARRERQDWKARAIEAETKRGDLERQFEEAKRAQQQPPPPPQQQMPVVIPDPMANPVEYFRYMEAKQAEDIWNVHLHNSEALLRDKLGDEAVDQIIADFKPAMDLNPQLRVELRKQANPYAWAAKQVSKIRHMRDVGDDPDAYEQKLYAKWEAERAANGANGGGHEAPVPRVSPAAGMAPSLATARSAAPRSAPAWTGEADVGDLLNAINGRKQQRRSA